MAESTKTVGGGLSYPSGVATRGRCPRVPNDGSTSDMQDSPYASIEVALTTAQILALNSTPVSLIPAPGATKVLQLLGGILILDYAAATYANGAVLVIKYTNASGAAASADIAAASVTNGSDKITTIIPILDVVAVKNAALVLSTGTAFITGDSPVRIKLIYAVHEHGLG